MFQSTLPLRGATGYLVTMTFATMEFQSTLPLRGATQCARGSFLSDPRFNPRSPYGERHMLPLHHPAILLVSIHAPLTGSDVFAFLIGKLHFCFNPRSPYGERRRAYVSIHAPLTGSDRKSNNYWPDTLMFQSTLPLRGATTAFDSLFTYSSVSIHAPLTGSDVRVWMLYSVRKRGFNPRSPYGERLISV